MILHVEEEDEEELLAESEDTLTSEEALGKASKVTEESSSRVTRPGKHIKSYGKSPCLIDFNR